MFHLSTYIYFLSSIVVNLRFGGPGLIFKNTPEFFYDMNLTNYLICQLGNKKIIIDLLYCFFFQEFESIECEWPLFYIYMIIDGVFKSQNEQIEEYQTLLKSKIKRDMNGGKLKKIYNIRNLKLSQC